MKTLKLLKKSATSCIVLGISLAVNALHATEPDDHTVVIRAAQTVQDVVNTELESVRFAEQIASYNGLAGAATVLPVGAKLAIPRPYLKSNDSGRIVYVKGDVLHSQVDRVVNPPARGSYIHNGDLFRTGEDGFVSLSFNSGARVNVQPASSVKVNDIDCARASIKCVISLNVTQGQVHSDVTPSPDGKPPVQFSVETPFLTAAVRGTKFYVDLNDSENRLGVTEGLVATTSEGAANDLPRGKGLSAKPGVVAEVVDLLEPPVLHGDSGVKLVSIEDSFSWQNLDGANRYKTTIATDETLAEPQFTRETILPTVTPELSFTPGFYYLAVSGVDGKDFIGLPALQQINFAEITDPVQPRLDIIREADTVELSISAGEGAVQLLLGNSIESDEFEIRTLDDFSETLFLELDQTKEWVFRVRRILGEHQVSAYSDFYVLTGTE